MLSVKEHRREAPDHVSCMVITVSDTRDESTDKSGKLIMDMLLEQGQSADLYTIVPDEPAEIREAIELGLAHERVRVILINGGTGIAPRDQTFETVERLLDRVLPGFGEIFRYLSYVEDIGSAAILSRAIAGTKGNKAIFSMPGSSGAVRLAMRKIILPELGHVVRELNKA